MFCMNPVSHVKIVYLSRHILEHHSPGGKHSSLKLSEDCFIRLNNWLSLRHSCCERLHTNTQADCLKSGFPDVFGNSAFNFKHCHFNMQPISGCSPPMHDNPLHSLKLKSSTYIWKRLNANLLSDLHSALFPPALE